MSKASRLYKIDNKATKKSINIEDTLYKKLKNLSENIYDATISELINVAIEDYIDKNKPAYYEKPKKETVTYRSIMIRQDNLKGLQAIHKKTGISVTRLLNGAVKDFLETYK